MMWQTRRHQLPKVTSEECPWDAFIGYDAALTPNPTATPAPASGAPSSAPALSSPAPEASHCPAFDLRRVGDPPVVLSVMGRGLPTDGHEPQTLGLGRPVTDEGMIMTSILSSAPKGAAVDAGASRRVISLMLCVGVTSDVTTTPSRLDLLGVSTSVLVSGEVSASSGPAVVVAPTATCTDSSIAVVGITTTPASVLVRTSVEMDMAPGATLAVSTICPSSSMRGRLAEGPVMIDTSASCGMSCVVGVVGVCRVYAVQREPLLSELESNVLARGRPPVRFEVLEESTSPGRLSRRPSLPRASPDALRRRHRLRHPPLVPEACDLLDVEPAVLSTEVYRPSESSLCALIICRASSMLEFDRGGMQGGLDPWMTRCSSGRGGPSAPEVGRPRRDDCRSTVAAALDGATIDAGRGGVGAVTTTELRMGGERAVLSRLLVDTRRKRPDSGRFLGGEGEPSAPEPGVRSLRGVLGITPRLGANMVAGRGLRRMLGGISPGAMLSDDRREGASGSSLLCTRLRSESCVGRSSGEVRLRTAPGRCAGAGGPRKRSIDARCCPPLPSRDMTRERILVVDDEADEGAAWGRSWT